MRDVVTEPPYVSPVEVRTIPRMRVARAFVVVEAAALWASVQAVSTAAASTGVAVAGVPIVVFEDAGALDLDTRDLDVTAVTDDQGRAVAFQLHPAEPVLGSRLALALHPDTRAVTIT